MVKSLRRRARLSQRRLSELGNISAGAIARTERGFDPKSGGPVKPELETLRGIAAGVLATEDGPADPAEVNQLWRQLAETAGYDLPTETSVAKSPPGKQGSDVVSSIVLLSPSITPATIEVEIAGLLAQIPDASIALTDLARGASNWDDDDREFVLSRLRRLAARYGQAQASS